MKVTELNRDQLIQLKQAMLGECSWGELAMADDIIPDESVYDYYRGVEFVKEDFCNE